MKLSKQKLIISLIEFGLTKSQAKLYVAGLQLGQALMAPLARKAEIKRTTAYYLMDELKRRRFFSSKKIGQRIYYIPISTKELMRLAKEKQRIIKEITPVINKL